MFRKKDNEWSLYKGDIVEFFKGLDKKGLLITILVVVTGFIYISASAGLYGLLAPYFEEEFVQVKWVDKTTIIRNIGLTLAGMVTAPLVLWRLVIASKRGRTAREGLITDRFAKAVDQLGKVRRVPHKQFSDKKNDLIFWDQEVPDLEARLGGLYALKRISEDSKNDHIEVIETFCAYLQNNSTNQDDQPLANGGSRELSHGELRADLQIALKFLTARTKGRQKYERSKNCFLNLTNVKLSKGIFRSVYFHWVDFTGSDLSHSNFNNADLTSCCLERVNFQYANMTNCKLDYALLWGADLRHIKGIDDQFMASLNKAFGVKPGCQGVETLLPKGVEHPECWFDPIKFEKDFDNAFDAYRKAAYH